MTAVVEPAAPAATGVGAEPSKSRPIRWRPATLFVVLSTLYFAVGSLLNVRYNLFDGDGPSRVAHAGFVLMSRDPHLSAIGFVWNPLPSILELPFVPLSHWWPELKTHGLAGAFQSAAFMAGSALLIRRIAMDRGAGTFWRWTAVGAFALNPVIILYGGTGLSEGAEVFCVLWCICNLLRWLDSQRVGDLGWAGMALGVGYLARYEVITAACGAAVLVAVVAFVRSPRQARLQSTMLSVIILVFPIAAAFCLWALTSWVVSGEAFATLSSQYGNASQVATAISRAGTPAAITPDWLVVATRLLALQPFAAIAVAVGFLAAAYNRKPHSLVPVVTFGAMLAFSFWGEYTATTFGWYRYYLPAIPMVIAVVLACWTPTARPAHGWRLDSFPTKLGAALLCTSLFIAFPVTAKSMLNKDIGNHQLEFGLNSLLDPRRYPPDEQWYRRVGVDDRVLAAYLDDRHLPDGAVLMDTFMNWGVWLASTNPKQFLIDTDYDFKPALNRPWDFGVQYILVTNPAFNAADDAVIKRYPKMWSEGADIGTLVHSSVGAFGQEQWRLYRIDKPRDYEAPKPPP